MAGRGIRVQPFEPLVRWLQPFRMMGPAARRLSLAVFLWGLGEGLWLYVRPLYAAELGANSVQVGQVLGVMGLAPTLVMIPAGRLVDRFGSRLIMILGWWIGTLGVVAVALAPDWRWLAMALFVYATSAFAIPAMNAYIALEAGQRPSDADSNQLIQTSISQVFASYFAGTVFSPLVGGWLGQQFGLRAVFWVAAGWFVLSSLVASRVPRPVPAPPRVPVDRASPGAARMVPWWRLTGAQIRIYGVLAVLFFCMALGYALVPSYLRDVRGLEVETVGGLGSATAAGGIIWLLLLGKRHSRKALVIATGLMALALGLLLAVPVAPYQVVALAGVYFLLGVYLTARSLSLGVVSAHTPPDQRGTSFGILETIWGVGVSAGPWLAGWLYSLAPDVPFKVTLLTLPPLMAVTWLALRTPQPPAAREQPAAAPAPSDR